MRALIIEDRDSMTGVICSILEKGGIETNVVRNIRAGLEEYNTNRYDIVILDTEVDDFRGMQFILEITPEYAPRQGRRDRVENAKRGPGVIVIRTVSERVPSDCPRVKAELVRPFTSKELEEAVAKAIPREADRFLEKFDRGEVSIDPAVELRRLGISYGESYVFFSRKNDFIQEIMGTFAKAGYDMFLITASRPKVARDRFGLDRDAEVFTLSGNEYKLGSMIESVKLFIARTEHPVVALDDLDNVIEHSSMDRTVTALSEILSTKKKTGFTFLTSVDGELLTQNIKNILRDLMVEYKKEE